MYNALARRYTNRRGTTQAFFRQAKYFGLNPFSRSDGFKVPNIRSLCLVFALFAICRRLLRKNAQVFSDLADG
jgi:hypothetical protein